ncbi:MULTISPECIES: hypothetical protein [unclassified Spiroplasma]|uniref:hypothetical protein n=1 Tax=unclassified Spiroplasma TaxID=2637901 RepID=UPI0030CB1C29
MEETVKKLIIKIKQEIKLCNSALSLRTLEDLINKYESELIEKDRKIDLLLTANREITYSSKSREYNQQQLYKENFDSWYQCDECKTLYDDNYCPSCMEWIDINEYTYVLKNNSDYDKLESKEAEE